MEPLRLSCHLSNDIVSATIFFPKLKALIAESLESVYANSNHDCPAVEVLRSSRFAVQSSGAPVTWARVKATYTR